MLYLMRTVVRPDVGGALRLGGNTTIDNCSFVSNMASRTSPAIGAVGMAVLRDSSFLENTFFCREKEFLEEVSTVSKLSGFCFAIQKQIIVARRKISNCFMAVR